MEATSKKAVRSLRRFTRIAAVAMVVSSLVGSVALANQGSGNGGGNQNTTTTSSTSTTSTTVKRNDTTFSSPLTVDNPASSGCTSNEPAWVVNSRRDLWHLVVGSGTTTVTIQEIMAGSATVSFGSTSLTAAFIGEFSSNQDGVAKHIYLSTAPTRARGESMPTSFTLSWSGGKTIGKTVWSHYCLLRDQAPPPVIDVTTATPTYSEDFTQSHLWTLTKSLNLGAGEDPVVKWFSKGLKPEYKVSGTQAAASTDANSYQVTSAQVTGSFLLQDAALVDASIKLVAATGSGLSDVDCVVDLLDTVSPYSYTCTLTGLSGITNSVGDLLSGKGFTISGSVTNGNTDSFGGSFGGASSSTVRSTSGVTATLSDNLASLDGSDCLTTSGVCSISGGSLTVSGISEDFTVTYTGGWDYLNYYTVIPFSASPNACEATKTNTATLTPDGQSAKTAQYGLTPKCPTPTVTLGNITSSYNLSYTDTYSWSVTKSLGTVDPATKVASYTVTATRSGPTSSKPSSGDLTIEGGFTTTYAPSANVSVSVTAVGGNPLSSSIPCTVNAGTDSYSCTVPATTTGLKTLDVADIGSGWSGTAITVQATVATGGGSNTDSRADGTVGTPGAPNITKVNDSAYVTDDLDSGKYSATNIACLTNGVTCWTGSTTVAKGGSIQTITSENQIVLTYDMNWLPGGVIFGDTCPTITNKAEVASGNTSLGSDTQSNKMTCPGIDVDSSSPTYSEDFTQSHLWTLTKSLNLGAGEDPVVKWFSKGLKPEYKVSGTQAAASTDANSYQVTSAQVTGSFLLQDAALVDASIKLVAATGSGLSDVDCVVDLLDTVSPYSYTCTLTGLSGITNSVGDLLSGKGFTISGSVTNGNTDSFGGSFGGASSSTVRSTSGVTATLSDNLASLDGSDCLTTSGVCSISGGSLTVSGISEDFTVTYTGGWDYLNYYTVIPFSASPNACEATKTNTATLTPDGQSAKTAQYGLTPKCPTPTVTLGNITSSYNLSYTDTYSWSVTKSLGTVDPATKVASYTVTATRSGPTSSKPSSGDLTIEGGFTTTYAPSANVSVSVTAVGGNPLSSSIPCTVNAGTDSYSCTVPATTTGLKTLDVADIGSGWSGTAITVQATVATGGGSNTDSRADGTVGTPGAPNITKVNDSAYVTDDLDSGKYSATNIACLTNGVTCWTGSTTVAKGGSIQTITSENQIVLTYDMNWLPGGVIFGDTCPTITNKAEVASGNTSLGSDTQSNKMTCPQLVMSITSAVPEYVQQSDNSYNWTLVKTALTRDPSTWQPRYQVVATRGAPVPVPNSWRVVDDTQKVTGAMTIVLNPATSVITADQVNASLKLGDEACTVVASTTTPGQFNFTCTKTTEDPVDAANGLNGKSYVLSWSGSAYQTSPSCAQSVTGCATSDTKWANAKSSIPGNEVNAKARIVDSNVITNTSSGYSAVGTIGSGTQTSSNILTSTETSTTVTMTYTLNWQFNNGAGCGQSITNTAGLINDQNQTISPAAGSTISRTVVVNCGGSEPGLTIGFYGNKQGGMQVVNNRTNWRTASNGISWTSAAPQWHNVLGALPNFGSDSQVRDYMNAANCNSGGANSGGKTCQTMFRAQALASVMNAIKSQAFADQTVMFQGSCTKVSKLFTDALASTTIDTGTTPALIASRIAYKSIFDDLNNSRATRCPNS